MHTVTEEQTGDIMMLIADHNSVTVRSVKKACAWRRGLNRLDEGLGDDRRIDGQNVIRNERL